MPAIGKEMADEIRARIDTARPKIAQAEAAVKLLEDAGRSPTEQRNKLAAAKRELAQLEQALKNQGY